MVKGDDKPTTEQFLKCADYYEGDLDAHVKTGFMIDNEDFLKDSLFCEWAYIINLDTNKLEVYEGFQTTKSETRYQPKNPGESGYWGCKLIEELPLDEKIEVGFKTLIKKIERDNE